MVVWDERSYGVRIDMRAEQPAARCSLINDCITQWLRHRRLTNVNEAIA